MPPQTAGVHRTRAPAPMSSTSHAPAAGRNRGQRRVLVALATAALHSTAIAQDAPDAVTLDTVQVTAPIARDTRSATKTGTDLLEIPQSVSVVTARQMRDRGIHGIDEAVWHTAGAQGGAYGPDTRSDWLLVRGFTPARYLDGLALPLGSGTGITRVEPYGLERVEVLKGPASVNYGAMPPGGLLNYVSKRPSADAAGEVELQLGSHDLRQLAADLGGGDEAFGWRLVGLARNSDSEVDFIHDDRYYFAPSLRWQAGANDRVTVLAHWQKADTRSGAGFLPAAGTLLPNPHGRIDPNLFTGEPNANDYAKTVASIGYEWDHDFGGGTRFGQRLRYGESEIEPAVTVGAFGLLADQRTLSRYLWSTMEDEKTFQVDNHLSWDFAAGAVSHTVLAGLDYRRYRNEYASNFVFAATGLDAFAPVYGSMPDLRPDFGPGTAFTDQTQSQVGLYLQDQLRIDRWVVTFGGRQDFVGTDTASGPGARARQSDERFSARVGVNYVLDNGLAPYLGWSQSFQPTVGTDFAGNAFVPTTGTQVEAGLKFQPERGDVLATVAAYQITQQNTLTVDPDHTLFSVQQGETRVRGVELEGRWNIGRGLSLYGAYAWIDSEVTESTDPATLGKAIALQPEHAASLGGDYTLTGGALAGLGFGAAVRYTGDHFGDARNEWRTPSYALFDASVHYDFGAWRLQVNAQNLTGREYITACNSAAWCYYGYGRTVTAAARFQW